MIHFILILNRNMTNILLGRKKQRYWIISGRSLNRTMLLLFFVLLENTMNSSFVIFILTVMEK